ncbi:MAG: YtxH domain-containing protein [Actinobacteria bacterium]|nr:YtxH domain-containing protein [Actinomycetota bacterium]MCG2802517.1 YtxH domain-containing protein [Cellulomonas sp.]
MKAKAAFVIGAGLGYLVGTASGRARYERMRSWALDVWDDPRVQEYVQEAREQATALAREQATNLRVKVGEAAKSAFGA